ncbi:hypothetical protein BDZ97DRAFT_1228412 [Flammula alnicola]|nr:hypothetical protein BDZ97DRAFT_1228412 [Flammula alnicola]
MSRYNNYGLPQHASSASSSNGFNPSLNSSSERHDERASQSGSEDGNYALYSESHKIEADLEDDANTALTSQTLNADGTPKRPMNAFMIFARRRRPQVSAENQAMRTGEISKILSKEWVSMPPSEKQFYLEQAKQLKETFNTRYPDYVYRRRPNNSRKRRRSDGGTMRPVDQALLADHQDDMSGSIDLEAASPTEPDDQLEASLPPSYSRPPYSMSQPIDHGKYATHSRGPGHQVSSESPFRSNGQHDSRLSYGGSGHPERMGPSMGSSTSPRLPIGHDGLHFAYGQSPGSAQSPSIFGTESITSHQSWQPRMERVPPTWLGGGQDSRMPNTLGGRKQSPYSATTPASPWSSSAEHPAGPSSNQPPTSPNYFPTLNTPFYPSQPHMSPFQSNIPTSPSLPPPPSSYEHLSHMQTASMPRDFTGRGYPSSSSLPSFALGRDPLSYPPRNLPPVQTVSGYSHSQQSSSSTSGNGHPPPAFWSRE